VFGQTQLAGGLALGVVIVGNAVLGHQAGGGAGDAGPGTGYWLVAVHDGSWWLDQGRIAPILTALCDMHIHILGICGTFMGGVAQLAVASGHKVTGCDANVYPPMSDQLREAGIELIQGFDTDQLALKPDVFVIGNAISRGNPLLEAILDQGLPYVSGPAMAGRARAAGALGARRRRHARQDDDQLRCWPGSSKTPTWRRAS
jgi:hypothetical protein